MHAMFATFVIFATKNALITILVVMQGYSTVLSRRKLTCKVNRVNKINKTYTRYRIIDITYISRQYNEIKIHKERSAYHMYLIYRFHYRVIIYEIHFHQSLVSIRKLVLYKTKITLKQKIMKFIRDVNLFIY